MVRAYANPSPGTMTTSARIWKYTPNARMAIPPRTDAIWSRYPEGAKPEKTHIEKSTRYPKRNEMMISSRMLILVVRSMVDLSVRMYWRVTRSRLNRTVKPPREICGKTSERL